MRNYTDLAGVIFHEGIEVYEVWVKFQYQEGFQI